MAIYVTPGVYVREIDASVYVPALAQTMVAMVGSSPRGPVDTPTYISSQANFAKVFGVPTVKDGGASSYLAAFAAMQYLAEGRNLWFVREVGAGSTSATATIDMSAVSEPDIIIDAASPGGWGNSISVGFEQYQEYGVDVIGRFNIIVYYGGVTRSYAVESFTNLSFDPADEQFFETVVNEKSDYININISEAGITTVSNYYTVIGNMYSLSGGTEATPTDAEIVTGLEHFRDAGEYDINLISAPGWSDRPVYTTMIDICEARGDCMAILDSPAGLTPQEVTELVNAQGAWSAYVPLDSSYAAIYYPWLKIFDPVSGKEVLTPPSGHVLRVFAYNDQVGESWYAPAGYNRGRVLSAYAMEYKINDGDNDLLYTNNVNPIRTFPRSGLVVWGQKTLQRKPSALDRVNVRRLLLYIRKAVATAVRYLVFEPNDKITWNQFNLIVAPFLNSLVERRGLYDFRVVCDETTNTPDVIDRNEMHAQIFIKPVKAAEFIQVDVVVTQTGTSFDEELY